jgi:hypothetical protein
MNADDYLQRLEGQLKDFPTEDRQDLLAEIASHLESGQQDPALGDKPEREARVLSEMGTPEQMGRGLRGLYRPNRLIDLLWLLIPDLIASQVIYLVVANLYPVFTREPVAADPQLYLSIRLVVILGLICTLVGWKRRSMPLLIFWLTATVGSVASLMTREHRWAPGTETIPGTAWEGLLFYAILAVLLVWLVRTLEQNRFDPLLVVFAALPLGLTGVNYAAALTALNLNLTRDLLFHNSTEFYLVGWLSGIALFFLAQNRDLRWLGLVLISTTYAIAPLAQYGFYLPIIGLYGALIAIVFIGWALDLRHRGRGQGDHRLAE